MPLLEVKNLQKHYPGVAALKGVLDKSVVDDILAEMNFVDDVRTEQLDVPTLLGLTELVRVRAPEWSLS